MPRDPRFAESYSHTDTDFALLMWSVRSMRSRVGDLPTAAGRFPPKVWGLANEGRCPPWMVAGTIFPLQSAAFGVIDVSRGYYRKEQI